MIKHILKIIWNQRRSNGWIFAELLVVVSILWVMTDSLLVDKYTYYSPLGFGIEDTYKVQLGILAPGTPGYVDDSLLTTRQGEDVLRLAGLLRQAPEVEEVSISHVGCVYTENRSWSQLYRADADTFIKANFRQSTVSPEYFTVLRMKDTEGNLLGPQIGQRTGGVITSDLERVFYGADVSARGKGVKYHPDNTDEMAILAVSGPVRESEYKKSIPFFYYIPSQPEMIRQIEEAQAVGIDCLVRMKSGFRPEDMERFLQGMGERLTVNNVYVSSVVPLSEMRTEILKKSEDTMKKKSALVSFMLINVFFGIIGTFWLRTQARQGEIGLRMALGSNRSRIGSLMNCEGLMLLVLTVPLVLVFILNMLYFDMLDTIRLPYTWWRFAVTFGGAYLLMAGMISLGIWFPMYKAVRMKPAEALHYE
ncbi:ABC transporter permease [uncultured Parabacteroides sp.]|uniref:ABC transporter permease n=1 Tax=Parabacteroides goldsteinii TaxID=328812 RepID=UPI002598425B|nr:ABC transporter permease [uncultured Parabacteroides sp.]